MTILMTILSSEMIGFSYPAYPACSRQGPSLSSPFPYPAYPARLWPSPTKSRVMFMLCSIFFA
jgi:hypothetical protein